MKIVEQSYQVLHFPDNIQEIIELAGRTCYKSEGKIKEGSAWEFAHRMVLSGHHAMIEFGFVIVRFVTNRAIANEFVRHRLASYAQESTRWVKYRGDIEFIRPYGWAHWMHESRSCWMDAMLTIEKCYHELLESGCRPQFARGVLPLDLKTEIVVGANIREWRHIFKLRMAKDAHPQFKQLLIPLYLTEFMVKCPELFDGLLP